VHPVHGIEIRAGTFATGARQDSAGICPVMLHGGIGLVMILDMSGLEDGARHRVLDRWPDLRCWAKRKDQAAGSKGQRL
jgi:hypothetical protein